MNKSFEFMKNRWEEGLLFSKCDFTEKEIDNAEVKSPIEFTIVLYKGEFFEPHESSYFEKHNVSIQYDPDYENFEYCACFVVKHDGTLALTFNAIHSVLENIYGGLAFYTDTAPDDYIDNMSLYDVEYIIGDILIVSKYDDVRIEKEDGYSFPAMREAVCIPIKCSYKKNEKGDT